MKKNYFAIDSKLTKEFIVKIIFDGFRILHIYYIIQNFLCY